MTSDNVDWLKAELDVNIINKPLPSTYSNYIYNISGSKNVCYFTNEEFSLSESNSCSPHITWSVDNNLVINNIPVNGKVNISAKNSWYSGIANITATLPDNKSYSYKVWVGKPPHTNLDINSYGNFNLAQNHYTQLTATYNGTLSNDFLWNFNYEWLIPYAMIRYSGNNNIHASVSPTKKGSYVYKVRAKNACGCSAWKSSIFEVKDLPIKGGLFISPF